MKVNKARRNKKRTLISGTLRNVGILVIVFASAVIAYVYIYAHPIKTFFPIKHISVAGNTRLTDEELRALSGVSENDSLAAVSNGRVCRQLLKSPWIKSASVWREFPDTVAILIREGEPFALLNMNEHLFLIDEKGEILEEFRGDSVPFLPVITGNPFEEKEGFSEAVNLIKLMNAKGFSSEVDRLEIIAHKPQELSVTVDQTVVKMGSGGYEDKIERLAQLQGDIKKMGIIVDYIDLRFSGKAIVKTLTGEAVKE